MILILAAIDKPTFNMIQLLLEVIFVIWFFRVLYPKLKRKD